MFFYGYTHSKNGQEARKSIPDSVLIGIRKKVISTFRNYWKQYSFQAFLHNVEKLYFFIIKMYLLCRTRTKFSKVLI